MDEVDQDPQIAEREDERDGDRQVRDERGRPVRDRSERQDRIDERGYEGAQAHLRPDVADEVPQHAGPELL